ncbi:hypothetical protein GC089_03350 [Cellulomonas sp. JZ18]|uniref:hypothetical protein n=1 Tax=Cellulomonas sp. JZ18 TaxID=2654191 RepID=UPI0012D40161|nr:hypothetical protein [Cellulomonas sp. JZ18]QGQ18465.1 hypothetical protein GC089_03350 [Cellulomonas sp. JZ18]
MDDDTAARLAVLDRLAAALREAVGASAAVGVTASGRLGLLEVRPVRDDVCPVHVVAEQFLLVTVGRAGRFELGWTPQDVALAEQVLAAAVAGRVEERGGLTSRTVVVTADGAEHPPPSPSRLGRLRSAAGGRPRREARWTYAPYRA